ncbi:MAG: hypothetical protein RIC55_27005 [Pirellulaceae bacterium]
MVRKKMQRERIRLMLTLMFVVLVAGAVVMQNVRNRGEERYRETKSRGVWRVQDVRIGWPLVFFLGEQRTQTAAGTSPVTRRVQTSGRGPRWSHEDAYTAALFIDVLLGILMVVCTAIFIHCWLHHRKGPLQFRLRSFFLLTAVAALVVLLIDRSVLSIHALLYPFLALGIVSIAFAAGLVFDRVAHRSDRRMAELRERIKSPNEPY